MCKSNFCDQKLSVIACIAFNQNYWNLRKFLKPEISFFKLSYWLNSANYLIGRNFDNLLILSGWASEITLFIYFLVFNVTVTSNTGIAYLIFPLSRIIYGLYFVKIYRFSLYNLLALNLCAKKGTRFYFYLSSCKNIDPLFCFGSFFYMG